MLTKFHPYHMVRVRPWPFTASVIACVLVFNLNWNLFFKFSMFFSLLNFLMIVLAMAWWKDATREASYQGLHHQEVLKGLKIGMILFIISEIIFFFSFFWRFFHFSLSPNIELGQIWPPISITSFNPINVPLLNTIILISSGASITWAHNSLNKNNLVNRRKGLTVTWVLGIYFSILQYMEYIQREFNISDSSYGNIFFLATGFHGIHVIIGSIYLIFTDFNLKRLNSNSEHFIIIDLSAWYWHFVDVVWLFLYLSIYWWGG